MDYLHLADKTFEKCMSSDEIEEIVTDVAMKINKTYNHCHTPLIIIGVLNGSYMFVSDITKKLEVLCEVHFIKVSSYSGVKSSGNVSELIGLNVDIKNRNVLIIEDMIDTGLTIQRLKFNLEDYNPRTLKICTFLYKHENCKFNLEIDFIGKVIPDNFVIGYGMDYNNLGRNINGLYSLVKTPVKTSKIESNTDTKKRLRLQGN